MVMMVMIVMIKGREKRMDDVFISPMNNEVDRTINNIDDINYDDVYSYSSYDTT
jgi:hypothetical protein